VFVWHVLEHGQSLSDAVSIFEDAVAAGDCESPGRALDFQLMKLACQRSHDLAAVLDPIAFTDDLLDYHLR
jgi:hypothetical protein